MTIVRILLFGLFFYFAYRVIVNLIIPVFRATRQVRQNFRDLNERMNDMHQQNAGGGQGSETTAEPRQKAGEYIDFEEIK